MENKWFKNRWVIIIASVIVLSLSVWIGNSFAKVDLEGEKINYEKLAAKVSEKEVELESLSSELKSIEEELKTKKKELNGIERELIEKQNIIDEAKKFNENKEKLTNEINEKKTEVSALDKQISEKEAELANLAGQIKEKEEAPIVLSAGQYVVGIDIPVSRYKAEPVGEGSNFVVRNSSGRLEVNTILGRNGESEYIFFTDDGHTIDTRSKVKLTQVE